MDFSHYALTRLYVVIVVGAGAGAAAAAVVSLPSSIFLCHFVPFDVFFRFISDYSAENTANSK